MARKSRRSRKKGRKRPSRPKRRELPDTAPEGGELRWRVLPCARDWRLTAATVALLLLVLCVVHLAFGHPGWVALSALVLVGALASFFLPTTYTLSDEGVAVRGLFGTTRREWGALRSHRADAQGVLLSPFSRPSRLDSFRGIYLRFQDNREQVMTIVAAQTNARGAPDTASPGTT
ncbi:MAG: hypothetical protein PVH68_00485 [Armatimonadota bacterium]